MMTKIPSEIAHDAVEGVGSDRTVAVDREALGWLQDRLTLADFGRVSVQIARAAAAKRPSELQRLLLAIVVHRGEGDTPC